MCGRGTNRNLTHQEGPDECNRRENMRAKAVARHIHHRERGTSTIVKRRMP